MVKNLLSSAGRLGHLTEQEKCKLDLLWLNILKATGNLQPEEEARVAKFVQNTRRTSRRNAVINQTLIYFQSGTQYKRDTELEAFVRKRPGEIEEALWALVRLENPDSTLCRFLRDAHWDVPRAYSNLISTLYWRSQEVRIDHIMMTGENPYKRFVEDPMAYIRGVDNDGRPILWITMNQFCKTTSGTAEMEAHTIWLVETLRCLDTRIQEAAVIFDASGYNMINYSPSHVSFGVTCLQRQNPDSCRLILVHNAPTIMALSFDVFKGLLNEKIACRIQFTHSVRDLERFVPNRYIPDRLGGGDKFEFIYKEPSTQETLHLKDNAGRQRGKRELEKVVDSFYDHIKTSAAHLSKTGKRDIVSDVRRSDLTQQIHDSYLRLDPYIRAPSVYERIGCIESGDLRESVFSKSNAYS